MTLKKMLHKTSSFISSSRLEIGLEANDYWALLFIGCISLFEHKLLFLAIMYISLKTHRRVAALETKKIPLEIEKIVLLIHMNHLQSLTEAIESNPQILYCEYRKKSLLSWCNFYNNTKALKVIVQMTQKYPREKFLAA